MNRAGLRRTAALITVAIATVSACGGDDADDAASTAADETSQTTTGDATAPDEETASESATAPGTDASTTDGATTSPAAGACDPASIDDSLDATLGTGAGYMQYMLTCTAESPLEATGEPVVVSLQNTEGDPVASFPEITEAMIAATNFINGQLGGVGADLANGTPGRPIQLETCKMTLNPADSVSCSNELAAKKPVIAIHGLSFFSQSAYPIFEAAGSVNNVILPNSPADFTASGVFGAGPSGGCATGHTAMVDFIVNDLLKDQADIHLGVPYFDNPGTIACYTDLIKKPIEILAGTAEGPAEHMGAKPGLTYTGIPVAPGTADMTAVATQIMDGDPDAIIYSSGAADCINLINALSSIGWSADETPLVMSAACFDIDRLLDAGDATKGIYFISEGPISTRPDLYEGLQALEVQTYLDVMAANSPETALTGFTPVAFHSMMFAYDILNEIALSGQEPNAENVATALAATTDRHYFASDTIGCANAPAPYVNICHTTAGMGIWDGTSLVPAAEDITPLDIIAGTDITLE